MARACGNPAAATRSCRRALRLGSLRLKPVPPDEVLPRVVAAVATAVLMLLAGRLLTALPRPPAMAAPEDGRIQLRLVARPPLLLPHVGPAANGRPPAPVPGTMQPAGDTARPAAEAARPPVAEGPPARAAAAAGTARGLVLYDEQGRVRLPDGTVAQAPARAGDPLDPRNPVDYRGTRFEGAWISDGDAADVAAQEIARAQKKIAQLIFGKDIEHARARPSPPVRYNPARHERAADLGTEATGDAWRAAPITWEPAPGLEGEASRRIREQVGALERSVAACDPARVAPLMAPVLQYLDELQRAEYAFARGADPIRAEHQIPNAANGAYDQARRALWYAGQALADCRR